MTFKEQCRSLLRVVASKKSLAWPPWLWLGQTIDAAIDIGKDPLAAKTLTKVKRTRRREDFDLVSSNVTGWGFAELQFDAWSHGDKHAHAPHVWCVQEHHRMDGAFTTMVNQCDRWGTAALGETAVPKNAGNSAGVAVLVKKYVSAAPVGTIPAKGESCCSKGGCCGRRDFHICVSHRLCTGGSAAG
eukprot:1058930-Amphidinium_carterae.3